jgi:hypothetical protein
LQPPKNHMPATIAIAMTISPSSTFRPQLSRTRPESS